MHACMLMVRHTALMQCGDDPKQCCFNGVRFAVGDFSRNSPSWTTRVTFEGLAKASADVVGCVQAAVVSTRNVVLGEPRANTGCRCSCTMRASEHWMGAGE